MKKTTETVKYTCDWCGEEFDASNQPNLIILDINGDDIEYYLTVRPIVYIAGEPHHDVCSKCINAGILEYAKGLKQ